MNEIVLSLAIIGNICNFAYNVPFVYVVYKHWNADNISKKFLCLRTIGAVIWIIYCILVNDFLIGISYGVTLLSSSFVLYIKLTQKQSVSSPLKMSSPIPKDIPYKDTIV